MSQHILISNSSETQGKFFKHILQTKGFKVTLKHDFWESLKILADNETDLVILDKHCPQSSPQQMCEKCLHSSPGIPILMSGLNWCPHEKSELAQYGALDVIGGPVEPESFMAQVDIVLSFGGKNTLNKSL